MLVRIAPALMLSVAVLAVTQLAACDSKTTNAPSPPIASTVDVDIGDAAVVAMPSMMPPTTENVSPTRAATLHDSEALPRDPGDTTDYEKEGDRYMAAGRPMEAIGAYRVALSLDDGAEMWRKLGDAYLAAGDTDRGVPCLEEAVSQDVGLVAARKSLVKHYLAVTDGAKARLHAEELVQQKPLDASARQMLGRAFMQVKMWKEAIDSFALVVKEQPDNIFAHNNIGYSALQIGELELAREHLERCLSLEPQQGYMLNNLGVAYERLGRAAEAHAAFSRAAELSPRYAQAKLNRDRLQVGLSQDQRIVSAETLMHMREPAIVDGVVEVPAPTDVIEDPTEIGVPSTSTSGGGSPRLAPIVPGITE